MWTLRSEQLADGRALKVAVGLDSSPVSFAEVLRRWRHDADFRLAFMALLADAPFSAFRWETPPITLTTMNRPFEFVLLDSPLLAREPDPDAFAEHFGGAAEGGVVEFPNLRKDAILVVPRPDGPPSAHGHLAAFARQAPETHGAHAGGAGRRGDVTSARGRAGVAGHRGGWCAVVGRAARSPAQVLRQGAVSGGRVRGGA